MSFTCLSQKRPASSPEIGCVTVFWPAQADGYQEFLESRGYTALVISYYVGAVRSFRSLADSNGAVA